MRTVKSKSDSFKLYTDTSTINKSGINTSLLISFLRLPRFLLPYRHDGQHSSLAIRGMRENHRHRRYRKHDPLRMFTLFQLCLVCHSWLPRSQRHLFERVTIKTQRQWNSFHCSVNIANRCNLVRHLALFGPQVPVHNSDNTDNASNFPSLQWLYDAVIALPQRLPNLHTLELGELPILHRAFILLCSRFKQVTALHLQRLSRQTFLEITLLITRFPAIHTLYFSDCAWPSPSQVHSIRRTNHLINLHVDMDNRGCRTEFIRWLFPTPIASIVNLDWSMYDIDGDIDDNEDLTYVLDRVPSLETISLSMSNSAPHRSEFIESQTHELV